MDGLIFFSCIVGNTVYDKGISTMANRQITITEHPYEKGMFDVSFLNEDGNIVGGFHSRNPLHDLSPKDIEWLLENDNGK
jgi:hypothetical protein